MDEIVSNLHWFPETIRGPIGDGSALGVEMTYVEEEELLGTAGGVRNVADFLTAGGEPFLVMAGDALTDIDFTALIEAHRENDGIATLAVKQVDDVSQFGVVVTDGDGRVQGFQEKPDPAEALSDLTNTMIYVFDPEVIDHFPDGEVIDFALDVFPALLDQDVPFHVHRFDRYWNDVGSIPEYLQGNLDAVLGEVEVDLGGELVTGGETEEETRGAGRRLGAERRRAGGGGGQHRRGRPHRRPGRAGTRCDGRRRGDRQAVGAAGRRRGPG